MSTKWAMIASLMFLLVVRLYWGAWLGLAEDEAYYWVWSQKLGWGYFDHPPMIAYWIAAGDWILGKSELGLRFFPILLPTLSMLRPM